jgi:hypothetical protein
VCDADDHGRYREMTRTGERMERTLRRRSDEGGVPR